MSLLKYIYLQVIELLSLKHLPFEEADPYQVRIGWSRAGTSNMVY